MAVPAPAIPSGNAYAVNVASATRSAAAGPLVEFACAAAPLLKPWKVPVRMHVSGDSPAINALRERLAKAGAKPSGFSPAPSAEIPGEGFWKTTLVVVEGRDDATDADANFWTREREDKKVGWDPLVIALRSGSLAGLSPSTLSAADLWCVATDEDPLTVRDTWMQAGAGAVAVVGPHGVAWASRNAAFGKSYGAMDADPASPIIGAFAARIVAALIRDLLGENLFDKTLVRADRECLGMRPLRLGRACGAPFAPALPWGNFGRKERHESHA
jgi:hypothetical protein